VATSHLCRFCFTSGEECVSQFTGNGDNPLPESQILDCLAPKGELIILIFVYKVEVVMRFSNEEKMKDLPEMNNFFFDDTYTLNRKRILV